MQQVSQRIHAQKRDGRDPLPELRRRGGRGQEAEQWSNRGEKGELSGATVCVCVCVFSEFEWEFGG